MSLTFANELFEVLALLVGEAYPVLFVRSGSFPLCSPTTGRIRRQLLRLNQRVTED